MNFLITLYNIDYSETKEVLHTADTWADAEAYADTLLDENFDSWDIVLTERTPDEVK